MTEKEYIKSKALGTVTAAINTLKDLIPANLEDVFTEDEYTKVMSPLYDWQERLFKQIKTESEQLKAFIRWNNQHNGIASPIPEKMADRYLESL